MTAQAEANPRAVPARTDSVPAELKAFVTRLHFYAGLLVGPFIFVAALTGTLFVLTPQIETLIYRDQIRAATTGAPMSLRRQAEAARAHIGDGPRLFAIRPAPTPGETTRVMFTQPGLGDSETRAVFVDPASLTIQGDLIVYGTSGTLPFRRQIDYLHRHLLLGEVGRNYSELAASWLWLVVLGGVCLWFWRRKPLSRERVGANALLRDRRLHGVIGVTLSVALLFLSVTGLTWSRYAGERIDGLRSTLGWVTPSVSLKLGAASGPVGGHHGHGTDQPIPGAPPATEAPLDAVLAAARKAGIDSPHLEIRPPRAEGTAWMVREYDRSWPTQVDTIALDPRDLSVTGRADFETFPLVAKLIRWGIDAHMGILFGLANQLLMALIGIGLMISIGLGYRIWWRQRPPAGALPRTLVQSWLRMGRALRLAALAVAVLLAWSLPVLGASVAAFVLVDLARWRLSRRASA